MTVEQQAASSSVLVSVDGSIGIVTLNRPKALNALNEAIAGEAIDALRRLDETDGVGAIVLTGSGRAFAAGADISEMQSKQFSDMYLSNYFSIWDQLRQIRKPIIAAVGGFALGGGCEVAMLCDVIVAAESAQFGQPEIKLGIIPGIGGTQRLVRAVGKYVAMDLILTGRRIGASEAQSAGLVSRVVPDDRLMEEACAIAREIAQNNRISVIMAKEAMNCAHEMSLTEGVRHERRLFYSLFATQGQKEGMAAFLEKRPPAFTGN